MFVLTLLAVRGLPAVLFRRMFTGREVLAAGLLQATSLPFIVTATQLGLLTGQMPQVTAAALVCAGLLSVVAFPALALGLMRTARAPSGSPG